MYETPADEYRFDVVNHAPGSEPTIYRGRMVQTGDDDTWSYYWDGDQMVAVYDDRDYSSPTTNDWTDRANECIEMCRMFDQDVDAALDRLAVRLFEHETFDARFIPVGLDRGVTIYCLSWNSDPDHRYRDEVEAVYHNDVWRFEVEEYNTFTRDWSSSDMMDEHYGENTARAAFLLEFPLDAFPAHLALDEAVGA